MDPKLARLSVVAVALIVACDAPEPEASDAPVRDDELLGTCEAEDDACGGGPGDLTATPHHHRCGVQIDEITASAMEQDFRQRLTALPVDPSAGKNGGGGGGGFAGAVVPTWFHVITDGSKGDAEVS